jgi:hypothetical protein
VTIEVLDGAAASDWHFHEAEAARLARVTIRDDSDGFDRAMRREQRADGGFIGREGRLPT